MVAVSAVPLVAVDLADAAASVVAVAVAVPMSAAVDKGLQLLGKNWVLQLNSMRK